MDKVTVYKVKVYDIYKDELALSRRRAIREGAAIMKGDVIANRATEIDASQLDPGENWTPRDFAPK
jgi:hypothetical protein